VKPGDFSLSYTACERLSPGESAGPAMALLCGSHTALEDFGLVQGELTFSRLCRIKALQNN